MQHKPGFSLIEIMIAVAIMAILAAVLVPQFTSYIRESRESATNATLAAVKQAITLYHAKINQYPSTLRDLIRKPSDPRAAAKWRSSFLETDDVPRDGWDNEIQYRKTAGGAKPYELYSYGANGPEAPANEWLKA